MVSQEMAYDLLYCKLNHIHPDLSHSHGVECFYQLLSLFTLKLIIDGGITNDFDGCRGYYIALGGGEIC